MVIRDFLQAGMIRRTPKIWFLLFLIALSSLLSGCEGGSSNEGASGIISITVTDYSGIRVPNATVVLGDSDGAMKASGTTDANGKIMFTNAPVNATVTAANTCLRLGSTTTQYSIDVQYDVNGSAVLIVDNCSNPSFVPPGAAAELGTLAVNVTNIPNNVTQDDLMVGSQMFVSTSGLITTKTLTLTTNDLNMNGKFSIVITGDDAAHNLVAYGLLLNEPFTDGITIDVPMEPVSYVQYQISNIPDTAVDLRPSLNLYEDGFLGLGWGYYYPLASAPSSTTIQVPYIPGLDDAIICQLDVYLDQDHDGVTDSSQSLRFESVSTPLSSQSFNMGTALSAPSATVTGADTATPTLSWSGVDPTSPNISLNAILISSATDLHISPYNLNRARTSIKYPELPDSLAPFRPNKVGYFSVYTSAFEGNIYKSSSGIYQPPNP